MNSLKKTGVFIILICSLFLTALFTGSLSIVHGANENKDYRPGYYFRRYTDNSKPLKHMYYYLHVPDDYDDSLAYPLVIFMSLVGQDVAVNSRKYIDSSLLTNGNDEQYPCIILIPLLPEGSYWVDNYFGKMSAGLDLTIDLIDSISQEYSVDQRKIYISGMCSTATGAWDALFRYPKKFAAGVLVANIAPLSLASKISNVPLWIFNSDADPATSAAQSRGMVEALEEAGNTKVRYTEYHNYDHVKASTEPFWEEELFPWMFSQTNLNAPYPEGKIPVADYLENPSLKENLSNEEKDNNTEDAENELTTNNELKDNIVENNANKDFANTEETSNPWIVYIVIAAAGVLFLGILVVFTYKKKFFNREQSDSKNGDKL